MSAYLDAELRTDLRARLERHIAKCPECRGVLGQLRQLLALLKTASAPEPITDVAAISSAVTRRLHESADD